MNNLLSYCGLTDARMRASEKDLPVGYLQLAFVSSRWPRLPISKPENHSLQKKESDAAKLQFMRLYPIIISIVPYLGPKEFAQHQHLWD